MREEGRGTIAEPLPSPVSHGSRFSPCSWNSPESDCRPPSDDRWGSQTRHPRAQHFLRVQAGASERPVRLDQGVGFPLN